MHACFSLDQEDQQKEEENLIDAVGPDAASVSQQSRLLYRNV
jgi:hypothetical protein